MTDNNRKTLVDLLESFKTESMADESITKQINDGLERLQKMQGDMMEEEQRLQSTDRVFTPNRNPFTESFKSSFTPDHPIISLLEQYESMESVELQPDSINPNTWMDYVSEREIKDSPMNLSMDTLAINVATTQYPLVMYRLEGMSRDTSIASLENGILSFCSQYNLSTGKYRNKVLLRVEKIDDVNDFIMKMKESIPAVLWEGQDDWINEWVNTYSNQPVSDMVEYDIIAQKLIPTLVEEKSNELKEKKASMDDTQYEKYLMSSLVRIQSLVGRNNQVVITHSPTPLYAPVPRPVSSSIPAWYSNYMSFIRDQIKDDEKRLQNFLTQSNIRGVQSEWAVSKLNDTRKNLYVLDYQRMMSQMEYDLFRTKNDKRKSLQVSKMRISNGDYMFAMLQFYDAPEKKRVLDLLDDTSRITETVLEDHKAEVLAKQNMDRKMIADKYTEEESGLQKLYREFQLGRQFTSIDQMGIEGEEPIATYRDDEVIDLEEAMELMMDMGEEEGQMDAGEYDSL